MNQQTERLRKALEPFAEAATLYENLQGAGENDGGEYVAIPLSQCREARAALSQAGEPETALAQAERNYVRSIADEGSVISEPGLPAPRRPTVEEIATRSESILKARWRRGQIFEFKDGAFEIATAIQALYDGNNKDAEPRSTVP